MCTKGCSTLSCLLYWMAWLNVILSMGAFGIGFVVLFSYPYYFGIATPIEIILTPIGLVFVLEIDNWMFNVSKYCYPEAQMEELWSFKAICFRDPKAQFIQRVSNVGTAIGNVYYVWTFILIVGTGMNIYYDEVNTISGEMGLSIVAVLYGYFTLGICLICMLLCCGSKCNLCEIVYEKDSLEENVDIMGDETKELSVEN